MVVPTGLSHPPSSGSTEGLRPVRLKEERKEAPGTKSLSEMRMEWNDKKKESKKDSNNSNSLFTITAVYKVRFSNTQDTIMNKFSMLR